MVINDQGDVFSFSCKLFIDIIIQVSQSNNVFDICGIVDFVDGVLNCRDWVREGGEFVDVGD